MAALTAEERCARLEARFAQAVELLREAWIGGMTTAQRQDFDARARAFLGAPFADDKPYLDGTLGPMVVPTEEELQRLM